MLKLAKACIACGNEIISAFGALFRKKCGNIRFESLVKFRRKTFFLDDALHSAELQKLLRRQMQLIGKLMRRLDYDAVREAIDRATGASRAAAAAHQRAEKLRDALLSDNDKLTEYVSSHPEVDVQQLRTLIRLARKEKEAAKPPKYFRELYRFLHAAELPALTLEKADDEEVA